MLYDINGYKRAMEAMRKENEEIAVDQYKEDHDYEKFSDRIDNIRISVVQMNIVASEDVAESLGL